MVLRDGNLCLRNGWGSGRTCGEGERVRGKVVMIVRRDSVGGGGSCRSGSGEGIS